ncbi:MAG: hypothetical protein NTX48_04055 [Planctomycetales bacterium]|nr:hypothetical protein [Planctomycetales bacterium]
MTNFRVRTRPPSAPSTAATQSAHAKPAPVRSSLASPEKAQRPEFTGLKTTDLGKNGFPGRLPTNWNERLEPPP